MLPMELVIFIGLQASGKSTFYRTHFAATHLLVSKDRMPNNKNPSRRQAFLVAEALQAGQSVVVDNTNPTLADRADLMQLGRACGAKIIGYYFESDVKQSLERNQQRVGKARVPEVAIYATVKKLVRPDYREGFDQLFGVRMIGQGEFDVSLLPTDH